MMLVEQAVFFQSGNGRGIFSGMEPIGFSYVCRLYEFDRPPRPFSAAILFGGK